MVTLVLFKDWGLPSPIWVRYPTDLIWFSDRQKWLIRYRASQSK